MKWHNVLIAIALLFTGCGGDDDDDGGRRGIDEEDILGSVSMKIDGTHYYSNSLTYTLDVINSRVRFEENDPEEGMLIFHGMNCQDKLALTITIPHELGEHELGEIQTIQNYSSVSYDFYPFTGSTCPYDPDKASVGTTEYFISGTLNLTEMGPKYRGTFNGVTQGDGETTTRITEGRFEFNLPPE